MLIEYCFVYVRQSEGVYNLNGAAVSSENKGVLILGNTSGMGKTTLALNLIENHRFKFIGDDKILIDSNKNIVGGSKFIRFNKRELFDSSNAYFHENDMANETNLLSKLPIEINLVIEPQIIPEYTYLYVKKWSVKKVSFYLYELTLKKIRGTTLRIGADNHPIMSIDNQVISELRSNNVNIISEKINAYSIIGNLELVSEKVTEMLKVA